MVSRLAESMKPAHPTPSMNSVYTCTRTLKESSPGKSSLGIKIILISSIPGIFGSKYFADAFRSNDLVFIIIVDITIYKQIITS